MNYYCVISAFTIVNLINSFVLFIKYNWYNFETQIPKAFFLRLIVMRNLKIIKLAMLSAVLLLILDSCSSSRSGRRGCDGNRKTRVPYGYM